MNVRRFRIIQTLISVALFIGVFFFCWNITKFDILNIQLSYFGVNSEYAQVWNSCIALLAISTFYNVFYFIRDHKRLIFKPFITLAFSLVGLFLFFTGAIDMTHTIAHNALAYLYFFAYPLAIFLLAHLNRKHLQYKEWKTHTIFSICMVILPLLTIKLFPGMAITEIIHSVIVIVWNLWILSED